MLCVKQGGIKYHFMIFRYDLGLNPGLPGHWRTLWPLDQWVEQYLLNLLNEKKRVMFGFGKQILSTCQKY